MYLQVRGLNDSTKNWSAAGKSSTIYLSTFYRNGAWYLVPSNTWSASTAVKISETAGVYNHITFVAYTDRSNESTTYYRVYSFLDGEYVGQYNFNSGTYKTFSLDFVTFSLPAASKYLDKYAMTVDNASVNYYKTGYSSGDAFGLDDYIPVKDFDNHNLYELSDVVYNESYVAPGYVSIGGARYYIPALANEAIGRLTGNATISATTDIRNLVIPDGIKSLTILTDKSVTLAPGQNTTFKLIETDDGYVIREPIASDYYTIEWYDAEGNFITETKEVYGVAIDFSGINADYADKDNGIIYDVAVSGVEALLGGERVAVKSIRRADLGGKDSVKAYAVGEVTEVEVLYYIGIYDEVSGKVRPVLGSTGTYTNYKTATNYATEVQLAESGATLVITSDFNASGRNVALTAGKTLYVDLNGHDYYHLIYNGAAFLIDEGASIYLYSSRPGARIFDGYRKTTTKDITVNEEKVTYYTVDETYADAGFFRTNFADEVRVHVGAFRGYAANLEYNGGTIFYANSYDYAATANAGRDKNEFLNDKKLVFTIDGGKYYSPTRTAYAMMTTTAPDVVFDIRNAEFYSSHASYAIFHDYDSNRFTTRTTINLNNCKIISANVDNVGRDVYTVSGNTATLNANPGCGAHGTVAKIFHTLDSNSTATIENCTILGRLYGTLNGYIILGEGNAIATTSTSTVTGSRIVMKNGVKLVTPQSNTAKAQKITLSFSHAHFYSDYGAYLEQANGSTSWTIIPGVFDKDYVTASYSMAISGITVGSSGTFTNTNAISILGVANWYNGDGSIYKTTYGFIGDEITKVDATKMKGTDLGNGWFDLGYVDFKNATEGQNEDSLVLVAGENKFTPVAGLVADIEGAQVRMDVTYTEYRYYLYFPIPDANKGINYTHMGDVENVTGVFLNAAGTTPYGWKYENGAYVENSSERGYLHNNISGYYGNSFYIPNNSTSSISRYIKFLATYDLNGNGTIEENEQNIPLCYEFKMNAVNYARGVIKYYGHGSEEANLVYETIRYLEESAWYTMTKVNATISSYDTKVFFDEYYAACNCNLGTYADGTKKCAHVKSIDEIEIEKKDCDVEELKEYVYGAAVTLEISKPRYELYLKNIEGVTYTIKATYDSYVKEKGNVVFKQTDCGISKMDGLKNITVNGETVGAVYCRLSFSTFGYTNAPLNITVTATYENGTSETVTGVYSLGAYIENNPEIDVAKALYALSDAALEYKLVRAKEQ